MESYIRTLPIMSAFFMAGWYMQNHLVHFRPQPVSLRLGLLTKVSGTNSVDQVGDGTYVLSMAMAPSARLPMIDINDTGKYIAPVLLDPDKYNGKNFTSATQFCTPQQLIEGWTKIAGKTVTYTRSDGMTSDAFTPEMRAELKKSSGLFDEFSYFGPTGQADLEWTHAQLKDELITWEDFVKANEPWFEDA